jgi:hypothetical protein
MARHRTGGSSVTLNGAVALPFSTARSTPPSPGEGAPRIRRPAVVQGSPELDVWLDRDQPPSPSSIQPTFSFPAVTSSTPPSPPPKDSPPSTPAKGGFYKNSSSIAKAKEHRTPASTQPAKLNWRDKGQDLAKFRRKNSLNSGEKTLSIPQIVAGAGGIAVVIMLLIVFANGRGKSPIVKHMERREQILAATLAPTTTPGVRCSFSPPPYCADSPLLNRRQERWKSTTRFETSWRRTLVT